MQNHSDWQHPFVDIFKRYNTFQCPKSYKGSVSIQHDPTIARKTFKLSGSILSNNTITIPDPTSQTKSSNLTGRYIYVQILASPEKYFCIHFEIAIRDREPGIRFTLTNMEKDYSVTGGNTLKIPFTTKNGNTWTVVCIDIQHHLENYGLFSKGVIKSYSGTHILKSIQICSNLSVRGIYTSSNIYDWDSLPKEMSFKMVKGGRWQEIYNLAYLPSSIDPAQMRRLLKTQQKSSSKAQFPSSIVQRQQLSTTRKQKLSSLPKPQILSHPSHLLPSQPYLQLSSAFSFSSLHNPDLLFQNNKVYYSAGGILVSKDIQTGQQLFLQGHTDYIVAMDGKDNWIVTVQEGVKSNVRIWIDHKCICSFQCPYEKVQQIRLSHKKHLAMVGLDPYKRQAILIFDISQIQITRKPVLVAKQLSDFNILTIKFSPIDTQKLVSCGKQNIRFWRVKSQHLPGSPVILNHHARNTIFTVFDFEYCFDDPNPIKQTTQIRHVFVGSQNGLLFQINYNTHQLEEVYKLHDNAAISSVVLSKGFCVTGSQDQMLRIWPMDFSEFTLEAANDGVVTNIALSQDNSKVACGTSTGTLNVLDLTTNDCKTIIRAHTEEVTQITYHEFSNSMITLSNDQTIRLWDSQKLQQTYQFPYPNNDPCLCISGNPNNMTFAAGFKSGTLRIIDIQTVSVLQQISHHSTPIIFLQYSGCGHFLSILQQKQSMLYSPLHSHQPIKHLPQQIPSKYQHSAFSQDSQLIALIGDSGTHVNLWGLKDLKLKGKIFMGKVVRKLRFQANNTLWVIFQDTSIRRYNLDKMTIQVEMQALHRQSLNDIDYDIQNHLLFSVGADSFVKVWDYSFLRQPHQVFIGHSRKINGVIFKNNRLWTVGSQGILVWKFNPSQEKFVPSPIFNKERKATFINNMSHISDESQGNLRNVKHQNSQSRVDQQDVQQFGMIQQAPKKIKFSNVMKKTGQSLQNVPKFTPYKIQCQFNPKLISFRKTKKRQGKPQLTSLLPLINQQNNLPLKHYYQQCLGQNQLEYVKKIEQIKENGKKFKLEYFVGSMEMHDAVIWNFMYGWYAYLTDNLLIVESLNKDRTQKIITLPQKISTLTLTKDFKKLICTSAFNATKREKFDSNSDAASEVDGSEAGDNQDSGTANIYVMGLDFTIEKKFQFHPRGIQGMRLSNSNKFLVSIGNFRECTVCVWDYQMGKLKASSCTLDKLNDISILENLKQFPLQPLRFATVGRDQIHFWTYSKDQKLQYYDMFIKNQQQQDTIVQLTSCDYLLYQDQYYLLTGTTKGDLIIVRLKDYKQVWRKSVCSSEIINIKCYKDRTVLGAVDGNLYFWNYTANILQSDPNPSFLRLNLYYTVNGLFFDQQGTQGVVSTSQAIYYVNLKQQFHSLLAGSSASAIIMSKVLLNGQYLLTSHVSGRLKLWNIQTAQQLKTYKFKYPVTQSYYDESLNKVVCFCQNQSVKLVNIKKFTKEQNYMPEELAKNDSKIDDYVVYTNVVTCGGRSTRWIFYKKGSVFSFQIVQQGKKKAVKAEKVLELGYIIQEVVVVSEKNLLLASCSSGVVHAYNMDLHNNKYSLLIVDQACPQDFSLQKRIEQSQPCRYIRTAISKVLNQTYLTICQSQPFIYFRNYMKRTTFQKITLNSIPISILLNETRKDCQVLVGLKEGSIITFNGVQPDQKIKYEGIVNDQLQAFTFVKAKNWVVTHHQQAMVFYSLQQ